MEKSDLDSFQNIPKSRNSFNNNQQLNIPSISQQQQQVQNQVFYHQQQQQQQHQVCQICGVYLKIDSNILNMSEPTYKQLGMAFNYRDDFETTLCSGSGGAGGIGDTGNNSGLGKKCSRPDHKCPLFRMTVYFQNKFTMTSK